MAWLTNESFMTILARLDQWRERGTISSEQHALLTGHLRGEPFSLFLELNILLYVGVLAFIAGLGWTVSTWSEQLGEVAVVAALSTLFAACLWYCFSRAPAWSPAETPSPNLAFDYVLYLGSLVWSVELGYLEYRHQILSTHSELYLLASAGVFFFLTYRFDNRFVLSLALTSLAAWCGLTLSRWPDRQAADYRQYAILYSFLITSAGLAFQRRGLKPHFCNTYLNIAANVLFWALLSGVFLERNYWVWTLALLVACGRSLAWVLSCRQFSFVAYAVIYAYVGLSASIIRQGAFRGTELLAYFLLSGTAVLVLLVFLARRFGRES